MEEEFYKKTLLGYGGAFGNPKIAAAKWGVSEVKIGNFNAIVFSDATDQTSEDDFKSQNQELYESLVGLNAFMISVKQKLLEYSLNPTLENLKTLIEDLQVSNQFFGKNINQC